VVQVSSHFLPSSNVNTDPYIPPTLFRTGDQGLIIPSPEKPHLRLTGRLKELINRGGEKISPLEIDGVLLTIEGVKEAVCFGVENEKYGEVVWAGIVLENGRKGDQTEEERIKKDLRDKISKVSFGILQHLSSDLCLMLLFCM